MTSAQSTLASALSTPSLGEAPPPRSEIEVQPSAALELNWVLHRAKDSHQFGEPINLDPNISFSADLARRVSEFWIDGARDFVEVPVLAHWSGTLFETDPSMLFRRIPQVLRTLSLHGFGLSSERPDEREVIERRLDHLARDPEFCSSYVQLLEEVWGAVQPAWIARGLPMVLLECAAWERELADGALLTDLLTPNHAVLQMGLIPLLKAGIANHEVVVSPGYFVVDGHILDFPGVLSVGVRATPLHSVSGYVLRGRIVARFAQMLGNASRAAILASLLDAPGSVAELSQATALSQRTVRTHLRILKSSGLVDVDTHRALSRFRTVEGSVDYVLNEMSARLQGDHGRAGHLHSDRVSVGAGFTAIFDQAPIAIIQLDLRGRCLACNPETQRMLGYSKIEIGQLRGTHLLADEDDGGVFELNDRVRDDQSRSDVRLRRKDGSIFWASVTVSAVCDDEGRVRFAYVMLEDLSDRRGAEDFLTGLPNRVLFLSQLERLLAASRRTGENVAVLMLDLDGFKLVNDTLGHEAGDGLLRQVGLRLVAALRAGDTVSRLGGDEFGVLPMGSTTAESAAGIATKLRAALLQPFIMDGVPVSIGASFGIALSSDHGTSVSTLMGLADEAMYAAKRNRCGYQLAPRTTPGGAAS
jgi:diguanylate cyclase (GGDEF)-like protein/PAS domain S-box-containing protein